MSAKKSPGERPGAMYLHARCHPTSKTWTRLESVKDKHGEYKVLVVICGECRKIVGEFELAPAGAAKLAGSGCEACGHG